MRLPGLMLVVLVGLAGCGPAAAPAPPAPVPVRPDDTAGPPAPPAELVENPQYGSWAKFPVGTTAVRRSTTETAGAAGQTVTTTTDTLVELTPEFARIRTQQSSVRYDGFKTEVPPDTYQLPRRMPLPPGVTTEAFGRPAGTDHGTETVTAAGKAYPTTWYKGKDRNEGGEVLTQVWSSPDAPGGLVKSHSRTTGVGKVTVIELIEVRLP